MTIWKQVFKCFISQQEGLRFVNLFEKDIKL